MRFELQMAALLIGIGCAVALPIVCAGAAVLRFWTSDGGETP